MRWRHSNPASAAAASASSAQGGEGELVVDVGGLDVAPASAAALGEKRNIDVTIVFYVSDVEYSSPVLRPWVPARRRPSLRRRRGRP